VGEKKGKKEKRQGKEKKNRDSKNTFGNKLLITPLAVLHYHHHHISSIVFSAAGDVSLHAVLTDRNSRQTENRLTRRSSRQCSFPVAPGRQTTSAELRTGACWTSRNYTRIQAKHHKPWT